MSQATIGALRVTLGLDSAAFSDGLSAAQAHLRGAGRRMQAVGTQIAGVGAGMSAAITAPFVALGFHLLQGSQDAAAAAGQVNAALDSMGGASGRTFEQLEQAAVGLRNLSGFDDDEILTSVTANMLTFGNVSEDAFDRAQLAAVNLSARLGQDLQSSALMVGKALNDPLLGLTALRRVGIQFTEEQEAMIESMVEVGDVAGAQGIMLNELERQFGGAAAAMGAADIWLPLKTALMDLEGAFEPIIRDVIGPLIQRVADMARGFAALSPETQKFILVGAALAAALGPVLVAVGAVVAAIGAMLPVLGAIAAVMSGPVVLAIAAVVAGFLLFKDDIIPALQSFGAAVAEELGPKIQPLFDALMGVVGAVGDVFSAVFGGSGSAGADLTFFGSIVGRTFELALDIITGVLNVVTNLLRAFGALLRGDFSAMWGYLGQAVLAAVRGIVNAFTTLFPEVSQWVQRTYEAVREWLLGRFEAVVEGVGRAVGRVTGFFRDMYVAVVGNSYVPDMVMGIARWMGPELQAAMVDPAAEAASETASVFSDLSTSIEGQMESLFRSIANKDWKGALGGLFDILGGQGGQLGAFGRIGSAIMGALPGFATGGSFKVGGSGGVDSQVMAFRATPGEMVDIRRPGQDQGSRQTNVFDMRGAVVTEQLMRDVEAKVANGEARVRRDVPGIAVGAVNEAAVGGGLVYGRPG